jgi:hypothetical protein
MSDDPSQGDFVGNAPVERTEKTEDVAASANQLLRVNYTRCLCTYVDVLGFRSLVAMSAENGEMRSRIQMSLEAFGEHFRARTPEGKNWPDGKFFKAPQVILRHFSDLIFRAVVLPVAENDLSGLGDQIVHEGINLSFAQMFLLEKGIVVRGGLTIGDVYWENDQAFGPGLVRAYELENDLAQYPRIILDAPVVAALGEAAKRGFGSQFFREDFDGLWFVDYLNAYVARSAPSIIFDRTGFREPFEHIRTLLLDELNNDRTTSSRRTKYLWLAKYFNAVIQHSPEGSGVSWTELAIPI